MADGNRCSRSHRGAWATGREEAVVPGTLEKPARCCRGCRRIDYHFAPRGKPEGCVCRGCRRGRAVSVHLEMRMNMSHTISLELRMNMSHTSGNENEYVTETCRIL